MGTILRVMAHQGEPEGLPVSPAVVRPATPEGLVGVPLRILIAEDNDFNRDLLEHMLARLGLSAPMAVNGREALDLLEREPFDLLLLDIHMPELDGFQVVGEIRERERTAGGRGRAPRVPRRAREEAAQRVQHVQHQVDAGRRAPGPEEIPGRRTAPQGRLPRHESPRADDPAARQDAPD